MLLGVDLMKKTNIIIINSLFCLILFFTVYRFIIVSNELMSSSDDQTSLLAIGMSVLAVFGLILIVFELDFFYSINHLVISKHNRIHLIINSVAAVISFIGACNLVLEIHEIPFGSSDVSAIMIMVLLPLRVVYWCVLLYKKVTRL